MCINGWQQKEIILHLQVCNTCSEKGVINDFINRAVLTYKKWKLGPSFTPQVLDGDENAAKLLAAEVHKEVDVGEDFTGRGVPENLPVHQFGVWIDPIGK